VLPMTMRFMTVPRRRSLTGRLFGGAVMLLLLVGVVFAPLCTALSLCTMPCCPHASSPASSTTSQGPCCTINRSDTGNDAVAISLVASQRTAVTTGTPAALSFAPAPNSPVATELATRDFRPRDRALHVLNSVFLI
jgi:hypothetical protein